MFIGERLLGITRDFWRVEDDESKYNGKSGYDDENGNPVFYEPAYYVCSLFKVANGTTFINIPRHFLNQNPPDNIYFCIDEKKHKLYLSFIEPRPEVPAFCRTLQKAEEEKDLFLCKLEWEKPNPVDYAGHSQVYDGD